MLEYRKQVRSTMSTKYLYILIDPNTRQVRYIGQSSSPKRRLAHHYRDGRNAAKHQWFDELRERNQEPILKIVGECDDHNRIHEIEKWLVQHLLSNGTPLLNITYAGPGGSKIIPQETIDKLKAAWKYRKHRAMLKSFCEGES